MRVLLPSFYLATFCWNFWNKSSFFLLISSKTESTRVEFSPEPVTQSRSPFHPIPTYSPSSISGAASMGSTFSSIGSISSNIGAASGTPTSSIQLTPTLTDEQVIRLTRAAERYDICNKNHLNHLLNNILLMKKKLFLLPDLRANINCSTQSHKVRKSDQQKRLTRL